MPRNFLGRLLPKAHEVRRDRSLRLFGKLLHQPNLWHLNRYSVAGAVSIGLFIAFIPVPAQMLLAGAAAIAFGCNLPVAVAAVWVSNPLTFPFMFFAAYRTGAWLLDYPAHSVEFALSIDWLRTEIGAIWEPLLLGSIVLGAVCALGGNVAIRVAWRIVVMRHWRSRRERNRKIALANKERAEPR